MSRPAPASVLALILATAAPAADWKGKPDPAPKDRPALTADPVADVTIPKFGFTTTVAFADQGGPFVALVGGGGSDGGVKVFDLRTGKPSAEVAGEFRIQKPVALSPDGRYLAGAAHGVRGSTAAVIDLKSGKVVHEFPAGRFNVEWLGFAGPDRLLVTARDRDTGVTVYDLKTGNPGKTLSIGRPAGRAVSPGGAYLAVGSDAGVRVFRLETGDEVGTLKPAETAPGYSCQGVAFSPDGKQLAGLFGFTDHKVSVWSLADGKLARTVTLDKIGPRGGPDSKLEWAADGSAWLLFNEVVTDPETGKPLWRVPAARGFDQARRLASAHAVVAWEPAAGGTHEYRLRLLTKPKAEVAAVRDAVRSGGTALDALLPAAKEPDLAQAKSVEVPLAGVDWTAKPDPAEEQPKVARQPVPLLFRAGQVEAAYVGRGERPPAVFELTDAATPRPVDPTAADGVARRVERVDLYTGRVTGRVSLPAGVRVLGAGPDAGLVLTTDAGKVRVDAWNPADGKHVAGWRPYANDRDAERAVAFAAVLGPGRVLTVSSTGKVVLWSVPDLKPAYVAEVPGLTLPTLTPGGKYLIGWQRTAFRVLDVATGEPAGDLLPGFTVRAGTDGPKAIAVRPDGAEAVAVVGKANAPAQLVRWDLGTGKVTGAVAYGPPAPPAPRPLPERRGGFPPGVQPPPPPVFDFVPAGPAVPSRLGYAGADHLLLDGRDLYSLKHNGVVWSYHLSPAGEGQVIGPRPDGRVWYVAGSGAEAALVAAELPGAEVAKRIKAATEGPGAVVKAGAKVAVKLDLTGSGAEAIGPKVLDELKRVWKVRGLSVVEDGADLTVKLTVAQKETDRVLDVFPPFRPGDAGPGRRGVKVIELECSVAVTAAGGKKVWESPAETLRMLSPYEAGRVQGVTAEDAEKALHRRTWEQVPGWAARAALPRFLAVDEDGQAITLPGRSQLTAGGVLPPANE